MIMILLVTLFRACLQRQLSDNDGDGSGNNDASSSRNSAGNVDGNSDHASLAPGMKMIAFANNARHDYSVYMYTHL